MTTPPANCKIDDCEKPRSKRSSYCSMHRGRISRYGDPHYVTPRVRIDPVERFWSKVLKGSADECWPYTGSITNSGYGEFTTGRGKCHLAHRFAYEAAIGPIPDGLTIDHVKTRGCNRKDCVNPNHLEAVTMAENLRRSNAASAINSRKTACPRGHAYDGVRVRRSGLKQRTCSICHNESRRNKRAEGKAAA